MDGNLFWSGTCTFCGLNNSCRQHETPLLFGVVKQIGDDHLWSCDPGTFTYQEELVSKRLPIQAWIFNFLEIRNTLSAWALLVRFCTQGVYYMTLMFLLDWQMVASGGDRSLLFLLQLLWQDLNRSRVSLALESCYSTVWLSVRGYKFALSCWNLT